MRKGNQMSMFDLNRESELKKDGPLAMRMRPRNLEEFFGQQHIVAEGRLLARMIKADRLSSMIFFGPPGSGKTTLAKIIANTTKAYFDQINAVTSGVADIRRVVEEAKDRLGMTGDKTVLFIDEIHRFNKLQQDALLPHVEDGTLILIGATTENPYYEVNSALVSRSTVFKLESLTNEDIRGIIRSCLSDREKGLGAYGARITEEALEHLVNISDGDARTALNALELAVLTTEKNEDGSLLVDLKIAEDCIQKRAVNYDKVGENHYDTISAFIKSMRGSDADAALHYLAKMLYGGEKPDFIARRIVICAAGCGDGGSGRTASCGICRPCRRDDRYAGGTDHSGGGSGLRGHGPEEQFRIYGDQYGHGGRGEPADGTGASVAPECGIQGSERVGLWRWL